MTQSMPLPTPTTDPLLPRRLDGFATLAEGLDYAARGRAGLNFFSARGRLEEVLPYATLRERALDLAARLDSLGFDRGTRMAIVAETTPEFLVAFFGCQYGGLVPVPLPLSVNFGGREAYEERLAGMLRTAAAQIAVGSDAVIGSLRLAAACAGVTKTFTHAELIDLPTTQDTIQALGADEPCYIQYSSGSTSLPRGVLVTQSAVADNAAAIAKAIAINADDRCVSWLPLYHDMGLVGCCLTPVMTQTTVDYIPTTGFARRPLTWLRLISEQRATISFGPTFGYELCVRRSASAAVDDLDLSSWRVAGIGGEMIRSRALQEFANRFAACGFDARALLPSYGLAEATLAVTFGEIGRGVEVDWVDCGPAFERDRRAVAADPETATPGSRVRPFVVCGRAMDGYYIEVRDEANLVLPDRVVGRVCIKGPSLMRGYFRNLQATRTVTTPDGWLDTGDMGYLVNGELVITGRSKDLIIFNGRNIWPQDLEWALEKLDGVRAGEVAAFSLAGDADCEKVVVIVECRGRLVADHDELRHAVKATVQRAASVDAEVVLAAPGSLTFTSSGKLSRAAAKANYLSGVIRDVAAPDESESEAEVFAVAS